MALQGLGRGRLEVDVTVGDQVPLVGAGVEGR